MKFLRSLAVFCKNCSAAAGSAVASSIGFREMLLFGGAGLISAGAWMVYPPAAFAVPGLIFVYVSIFGTA